VLSSSPDWIVRIDSTKRYLGSSLTQDCAVGEQGGVFDLGGCSTGSDAGGVDSGDGRIMKKLCVVATVDYYLVR
jgi:hypothetical protein